MTREELLSLVISVTKRVVADNNIADPDKIDANTHLYGRSGILDSLGLVQLIADLEDEVLNQTGKIITIADERAMSAKFSPFRTVSALANYINVLLDEQEK
ncbi:MAG TPA: hypothetical protein VK212_02760 [Lentimicrobium sp.]|nr:hypothetical protein [Lentimicrobium sp.]